MCGIAGYVGYRRAAPILVEMLRLLEYRGYDSVGIATMDESGRLRIAKGVGSIDRVLQEKNLESLPGRIGIGHTRRSTHGRVTDVNAHPHTDCSNRIAIVHNGVIQNYLELKQSLIEKGHRFRSETDTEVLAHMLEEYVLKQGADPIEAFSRIIREVEGNFSIAVLISPHRRIYFAKKGLLPLIVGVKEREAFVASDVIALAPYVKDVVYLESGEFGYAEPGNIRVFRHDGTRVVELEARPVRLEIEAKRIDKGGFAHRMHKEIYDIPHFASMLAGSLKQRLESVRAFLEGFERIRIVGAGSSYHASLYAEYVLSERYPRKFIKAVIASEFPNFLDRVFEDDLVIAVSQSGETYDVLEPVRHLKSRGVPILAVVNRRNSELDRIADQRLYIEAGIERAVAATKTFVNQVLTFYALAFDDYDKVANALNEVLARAHQNPVTKRQERIDETALWIAKRIKDKDHAFYLGRYLGYVLAKEGALKIKEVSYIHAEAYPSGELKHGPLALIEEGFPVFIISYSQRHAKKDRSTYEEVRSRGAEAFVIAPNEIYEEYFEGIPGIALEASLDEHAWPIVMSVPMFLIAYHAAVLRGRDPDKPRNLAKSVTVE